jgi:ubiquinone/menaquinone biosynthesis C-methylase UbiE
MQTIILSADEVLSGYDAVSPLYPYIPPLSHWRAWEYAAYQKSQLSGRVLDIGCGDGRYFHLVWPKVTNVVGVEADFAVAELARQQGVYQKVHLTYAHQIPEPDCSFDHVFANCSLEHMDHLDAVLAEIFRCLKPNGTLTCSIVTNRFLEWCVLPRLISLAGFSNAALGLQEAFVNFHHVVNPLSMMEWMQRFVNAGFIMNQHIPILPKCNSGIFLLMENLWHVKRNNGGEMGDILFPFLSEIPNFQNAFRKIFEALLVMETDWLDCSGGVFSMRKEG